MTNRLLSVALVALTSGAAFAQAPDAGSTAPDGSRAPLAAAPAPEAPATFTGSDESIYVVQQRAYSKSGKFEVTPSFFTSLNNKFVGHLGPALSVAYHMRENLGVELSLGLPVGYDGAVRGGDSRGLYVGGFYSGLVYEVRQINLTPEVVDLKQMTFFAAVALQYSALYGKLDFAGYLIDYDFYATVGTGPVKTVETCVPPNGAGGDSACSTDVGIGYGLKTPEDGADGWKIAGNLGGGMRVFFSDWIGLRLEVRDIVYADRASEANVVTTDVRNNVIMFLGGSFLL